MFYGATLVASLHITHAWNHGQLVIFLHSYQLTSKMFCVCERKREKDLHNTSVVSKK